jgi:peroxiredoxin
MPNHLTGDFDAVMHFSVRQINGLLATLHQNRVIKGKPNTVPHSEAFRVGPPPAITDPEIVNFGTWMGAARSQMAYLGIETMDASVLLEKSPPGVRTRLRDGFIKWTEATHETVPADNVRGRVEVQISSPMLSLEEDATTEIIVSQFVRAHYYRDFGSKKMPEPVHGEVWVAYQVTRETSGDRALKVLPPTNDSKIQFVPEAGTVDPAQDAVITKEIRKLLRERFDPKPNIPPDFAFYGFKAIGSAISRQDPGMQALALPVPLSGGGPPAGDIQSISSPLLTGLDDFAVAVSKEAIEASLSPSLNKLRLIQNFIPFAAPDALPTYRISVLSAALLWNNGWIDLRITAKATTPHTIAPNFDNITINQRMTLVLGAGQNVSLLAADSDLTISGVTIDVMGEEYDLSGLIKSFVVSHCHAALAPAQAGISQSLGNSRHKLNSGLKSFDEWATANFTKVEVTVDGIVLRGTVDTSLPRKPPVIAFRETDDGGGYTALESWIPGGRITHYAWSMFELVGFTTDAGHKWVIPWFGKHTPLGADPHRFILPKPTGATELSNICLAADGIQISGDGRPSAVSGSGVSTSGFRQGMCAPAVSEPLRGLPPGWEVLNLPKWLPRYPDRVLEESIFAHVDAVASTPLPPGLSSNHLVFFADWHEEQPMHLLSQALSEVRRRDCPLTVIMVLPVGSMRMLPRDFDTRMGLVTTRGGQQTLAGTERREERSPVTLEVTEDYESGWTQTFAAREAPAHFLMNAAGELVFQGNANTSAKALASALDANLMAAPRPQPRLVTLALRPGDPGPELQFRDTSGERFGLHRLLGKRVLLNFWQSWSAPCVRELRRLQELQDQFGRDAPFVAAFCGDREPKSLERLRHEHRLSFPLVHDAHQQLARLFKVRCWPTTVSINEDGIVDHVQFGAVHERARPSTPLPEAM